MYDLAIIGAGIVGAMAAYLARRERPDWRILLLDRSLAGDGATGYSVGLDIPYGRTPAHKKLSIMSARVFRELRDTIAGLPLHDLPMFGLIDRERLDEVMSGFTSDGVRAGTGADTGLLRESYADLAVAGGQVLLAGCDCSFAAPRAVTAAIIDWLKRDGLTACWEGAEVRRVRDDGPRLALETSDGRTVPAARALIATGPWLLVGPGGDFAKSLGVRIKKIVALYIDRCPKPNDPLLFFFDEDAFLLPRRDRGQWLFSFTSQEWDCEPEISRLSISPQERELAISILRRYCPSLVDYCRGGRVFCDAYSRDRVPVTRRVPGPGNCVIAGAASGSGYRLAPAIAAEALKEFS